MKMAGGDEYLGMFKQGTYHGIGQVGLVKRPLYSESSTQQIW